MTLGITALAALGTSALSAAFGMVGGLVLMGVYGALLAPAPAIALHGITQVVANGSRALGLARHVHLGVLGRYAIGAVVATLLLRGLRFAPDPALLYLTLGAVPWLARALPPLPDVTRPGVAPFVGALVAGVQAVCGVAGPLLDVFFLDAPLDRRAVVATKAATQTLAHLGKIVLYADSIAGAIDAPTAVAAVGAALIGTRLGAVALDRMGEGTFRTWTGRLVLGVGAIYVVRGAWALYVGQPPVSM